MTPVDALYLLWLGGNTAGLVVLAAVFTAWVRRIEDAMHDQLDAIQHTLAAQNSRLDQLATSREIEDKVERAITSALISLMRSNTAIGSIITGGGGAAVGGNMDDHRQGGR